MFEFVVAILCHLMLVSPTIAANAQSGLLKMPLSSKVVSLGSSGVSKRFDPKAPLRNAIVKVVTPVKCGNDQTFNDVLIDTGSGILWVGGEKPYEPGLYSQNLNATFGVGYGIGSVSGNAFRDNVVIGDAVAKGQIVGASNNTQGFTLVSPIDGILGLGPSGSNAGDVSGFNSTPTFVETLVSEGRIGKSMFGVFISPLGETGIPEGTGEISFGGVDESRIRGDVTWLPQLPPVNFHWEFNLSSFRFGNVTLNGPTFSRTDTGVLPISLAFDTFFAIIASYNGTISQDHSALNGFLSFPSNAAQYLPSLEFTLGTGTGTGSTTTFSIPPSRYIVPKELYASLNVTNGEALVRTWIASGGPGEFMMGQKWLENVYTAYDLDNHRIGFAHLAN